MVSFPKAPPTPKVPKVKQPPHLKATPKPRKPYKAFGAPSMGSPLKGMLGLK